MYYRPCHPYQWYSPVYYNWNGYNWGYNGNSYYPAVNPYWGNEQNRYDRNGTSSDHGAQPFVVNIEEAAEHNNNFRTALWTGKHLQVTLMSLNPGEDVGLEMHPDTDQFLRIEDGKALVKMGDRKENLYFQRRAEEDDAIMVPAGTWHNIINTGDKPLKLYSIYAPPHHPFGTVQETKAAAMAEEEAHS